MAKDLPINILYVTSFNKELYEVSGKQLLQSFNKTKSEGHWFLGIENINPETIVSCHTTWAAYNIIDRDYQEWFENHKDIIPKHLGGLALPCNCKNPWSRSENKHTKGCYHTWFNRNTSRWYKKIHTLDKCRQWVLDTSIFDYVIWLDCDVVFKQKITGEILEELFQQNDLLYLKGKRPYPENGFIGFNYKENKSGGLIIEKLYKFYKKDFRNLIRWDDCSVLLKIIKNSPGYRCKDIANRLSAFSGVFEFSEIGQLFTHNKGKHGRKLGIMK